MRKQGCVCILTMVLFAVLLNNLFVKSAEAATITVTAPHAGTICYKGEPVMITWTQQGYTGQTVAIHLRKTTWDITIPIANVAPNTGTFSWMIPDNLTDGSYQVMVSGIEAGAPGDEGDAFEIRRKIASNMSDFSKKELKKEGFAPAPPSPAACQPIQVTSPVLNQWCYINEICTISWDKANITSYGSVFLHVVQWDAQHPTGWEGGGYPVANTGSYQWTVPENVGPLESTAYFIRIKTPDGKCEGQSQVFGIKKKVLMNIPRERIKRP